MKEKNTIRIGIAEDHLFVRQGMVALLNEYEGLTILFDVENGKELLDQLAVQQPDVILLDIEMPVMNGKEALEQIKINYPGVKVIIVSMHFDDAYIIEFIKKGAAGFLPKNCDIDKIVEAVFAVHTHGYYFDSKVSIVMANRLVNEDKAEGISPEEELTEREIEIIRLICYDRSNREIAELLTISPRTVDGHRSNIMRKTKSKNAMALMAFAIKFKIIEI